VDVLATMGCSSMYEGAIGMAMQMPSRRSDCEIAKQREGRRESGQGTDV
jgi:hypothetical protein